MGVKYDSIGTGYNLTRKADKLLTENLLRHLAPEKDKTYLDIGCGTGSYTIEFQKRGYHFIGIDPSEKMLLKAKSKSNLVDWKIGSAEDTNLAMNAVEGIIGSLTIHHWTDLSQGFKELFRVLKAKGKIVIFTSTADQMEGYWLNHYFPKMLKDSIKQMPSLKSIKDGLSEAGFYEIETEIYSIHQDLEDKFLFCGKHDPEIYFDQQIRNGISSFSSLANIEEVSRGLENLRTDIDSGKISQIIAEYENQLGDYLYVIARKSQI